jgi:hypothetical protein
MAEVEESKDIPPSFSDERVQQWMEEHLTELKLSSYGPSILYTSLAIAFAVGLAAHIGGYALLSSVPTGPLGLFADLLHALGWSLWTGVVVALFVQVIPEAKRAQIRRAIDAYEASRRGDGAGSGTRRSQTPRPASDRVRKPYRSRKGRGSG